MQPSFLLQTAAELCVRQTVKQPDHRDRDGAVLDQLDHRACDGTLFGVEADDEPSKYKHAMLIDGVNSVRDVAARVLFLAHLLERLFVRALDPDEQSEE